MGPRKIYRLTWHNLFGHQSTQSVFLVKMTKMPLVNPKLTKSQTMSKSSQNNIFHGFISNPSSLEIFSKFNQVWPRVDSRWAPETLTLIRSSNSNSNDYSWVKIGVKTVEILRKSWKACQHVSWGHNFSLNRWNFNFFSFLKTRHPKLSKDTKISSIRV